MAGAPTASLERPRTGVSRTQENGPCPAAPGGGRTPARPAVAPQPPSCSRCWPSSPRRWPPARRPASTASPAADPTYAELGRQALHTLEHGYYDGAGEWNVCVPHICGTGNVDWGVDSLTYALYFHWSLTHDRAVRPIMSALRGTAVRKVLPVPGVPGRELVLNGLHLHLHGVSAEDVARSCGASCREPHARLRVPTTPASGSGSLPPVAHRHAHRAAETRCLPAFDGSYRQ